MTETTIGLSEGDLRVIRSVLAENREVQSAVLFGSRAKGTHRAGSDVDIALMGDDVTFATVLRVGTLLNEAVPLPYRFDVLAHRDIAHKELLDHIGRVGVPIYTRG